MEGTRLFREFPATPPLAAGTQNLSGQSVFSVVPVTGILDPGKAQDFTVTFSPDHESLYFSDRLQVVLFEKVGLRDPCGSPSHLFLLCPTSRPKTLHWGQGWRFGVPHLEPASALKAKLGVRLPASHPRKSLMRSS